VEIAADRADFTHGQVTLPPEGQLSVPISSVSIIGISYGGSLVVRRQLHSSAYPGRPARAPADRLPRKSVEAGRCEPLPCGHVTSSR